MQTSPQASKKILGVFSLAMITAGSVDSIRNLPATALFGSSLIFFFIMAAILFLLPCALISAELASNSQHHGGIYIWVKNAFGVQTGFLAIWFQWISNVIWYPTILSFVAGTIGYLISPQLANNKIFLISVILCAFWGATLLNLFGMKSSAHFSNFCTLVGLILPMTLIISLGTVWLIAGKPMQIHISSAYDLLPNLTNHHSLVALTGIILSFCGVEIATVHAGDVYDPQRSYPRAMLIASLLIVITLLCGALAIAIVLPAEKISLVAGIMQAFNAFFMSYHIGWILPGIAIMLVLGGIGAVSNWIIAPTRGLMIAAQDGNLPDHMKIKNRFSAPSILLIYQAIIVTIITMAFLFMPSVNGSYWLLTVLAAQLYMLMYMLLFLAAIKLRYQYGHININGFCIPGGNFGIGLVSGIGFFAALLTFMVGFVPPNNIQVGSIFHYEMFIVFGLLIMILPAFILPYVNKKQNNLFNPDLLNA